MLALMLIPDVRESNREGVFDWRGFAFAGTALAALFFGFELSTVDRAESTPASSEVITCKV